VHRSDVLSDRQDTVHNLYRRRSDVRRLVLDGLIGTRNAWRRWPRPQTGRRHFVLIIGGRP
jgi:hypothetical protein